MTPHHPLTRLRALQDRATGLFLEATHLHRAYLTRHILPGHPARAALLAYHSRLGRQHTVTLRAIARMKRIINH